MNKKAATFIKDGETYTVTKRGLFFIEGYRLVETERGTAREYDKVPRDFIVRFYDWLDEIEVDYPGPFWGTATIVLLVFLAYLGWVIYMFEPWIYGVDIWTAVIVIIAAVDIVVTCLCVRNWFTEAIITWARWRKMKAK